MNFSPTTEADALTGLMGRSWNEGIHQCTQNCQATRLGWFNDIGAWPDIGAVDVGADVGAVGLTADVGANATSR